MRNPCDQSRLTHLIDLYSPAGTIKLSICLQFKIAWLAL